MHPLTQSEHAVNIGGADMSRFNEWLASTQLVKDQDYTYTLVDVFPPCFRYYFRCSQQHLMAVLAV